MPGIRGRVLPAYMIKFNLKQTERCPYFLAGRMHQSSAFYQSRVIHSLTRPLAPRGLRLYVSDWSSLLYRKVAALASLARES